VEGHKEELHEKMTDGRNVTIKGVKIFLPNRAVIEADT
jgi:hypothetical protein